MALLTSDIAWRSINGRTPFFAAVRSIDLIPLILPVLLPTTLLWPTSKGNAWNWIALVGTPTMHKVPRGRRSPTRVSHGKSVGVVVSRKSRLPARAAMASGSVITAKSDAPISRDSASLVGDVEKAVTLQPRACA